MLQRYNNPPTYANPEIVVPMTMCDRIQKRIGGQVTERVMGSRTTQRVNK